MLDGGEMNSHFKKRIICLLYLLVIYLLAWLYKINYQAMVRLGSVRSREHFIYFALHKTGSTNLRHVLQKYCSQNKKVCLDYEHCDQGLLHVINCMNLGWPKEDPGSFTAAKIPVCCPLEKVQLMNISHNPSSLLLDGLLSHFHLGSSRAMEFLSNHTYKDAVRFTIVRHPLNQLYSYYHYVQVPAYWNRFLSAPSFADFIRILYHIKMVRNVTVKSKFDWMLADQLLLNSQSKELGFVEKESNLEDVLRFVQNEIDFVGLNEYSDLSSQILFTKFLNWPGYYELYLNMSGAKSSTSYLNRIDAKTKVMMAELQYADLKLYQAARDIFFGNVQKFGFKLDPLLVAADPWE